MAVEDREHLEEQKEREMVVEDREWIEEQLEE